MTQDRPQLIARLDSVRILAKLLGSITLAPNQIINCFIRAEGIQLISEKAKCVQALTFMGQDTFREFNYSAEAIHSTNEHSTNEDDALRTDLSVAFNGSTMLSCLDIFGHAAPFQADGPPPLEAESTAHPVPWSAPSLSPSTAMKMICGGPESDLEIILEEKGVITGCRFATYEPEPLLDLDFQSSPMIAKLIMKSEWLRDAFSSFEAQSNDITFTFQPYEPYFQIATTGITGSTEMDYSRDSDVIEYFACQQTVKQRYRYALLAPILKPLGISTKTSIRLNEDQVLSLQFMVPLDKQTYFVEYLCLPSVDPGE